MLLRPKVVERGEGVEKGKGRGRVWATGIFPATQALLAPDDPRSLTAPGSDE